MAKQAPNPKIAIALLNWNGRALLEKYLPSVVLHSPVSSVWVIDNGSTDDSLDFLKTNFPEVHTLPLDKNYGFTGGYNRAIEQLQAEIVVLLNTDIRVTANWTDKILEVFDSYPSVGIAMPKLLDDKKISYFEYAGAAGGMMDRYGYPFCRGRIFEHLEEDKGQYEQLAEIFWASGAAMCIRRALYVELGGLDDDLFAHMEEIDLCWRARNQGYQVVYVPQSTVYHYGGATLNKLKPKKTFLNFRNSLLVFYKNTSPSYFRRHIFIRLVLDGIAALVFLGKGRLAHFWAVFSAHMDFYTKIGRFRKKKHRFGKEGKYHDGYLSNLSIVWRFYAKGEKTYTSLPKNKLGQLASNQLFTSHKQSSF